MSGSFEFHRAASLDEALDLLDQYGDDAHLMAGGTSVMLLYGQGLIQPGHMVGIRSLPGLSAITRDADGWLHIGALATHRQVETSVEVSTHARALAECFGRIATIRIRNQATVGGNLVHADPAQDPPPMLMALDAEVVVQSKAGGTRTIKLDDLFVDYFESALEPGEILTEVRVPPSRPGTRAAYTKFLPRTEDDYATVSVGAALTLGEDGETCADVRIALGSAGVTPIRATAVEDALRGQRLDERTITEAAALVEQQVDPLDDVRGSAGYKRQMARVWTARTLRSLVSGAADGAAAR